MSKIHNDISRQGIERKSHNAKHRSFATEALSQLQEDQDDSNGKRSNVNPTALKIVADDMRNPAKADERPERQVLGRGRAGGPELVGRGSAGQSRAGWRIAGRGGAGQGEVG